MANVLTNLAPDIMIAADKVGREMVGFVTSCTLNSGAERAAKNDNVRSFFTRAQTVNESDSPSMTIPEGTDQTIDTKTLVLDKYISIQIPWTGEDTKHVNNGNGYSTIYGDQVAQAMRAIVNKMETYGFQAAYRNASRAVGTAGTTPFASNHSLVASVRQILVDNGCPMDGQLSLVMSTSAGTNMRNLTQLQKVNEAGGADLLRQGVLLDLQGIMMKESAACTAHTIGSGSSYQFNGAGAVGDTTIAVDTGSGTILAGDILTLQNGTPADSNKYVVNTALSGGNVIIGSPGLRSSHVDNDTVTVGASYTPNVCFHRSALELAMRPPAMPEGGDAADDVMIVQDPWSGLVFEIASYKGYRKRMIEVRAVYGWKAWKPDHIATLLG